MNKIELRGLDTYVYTEVLESGLQIFVVPNENVNKTYVTYSTKLGSVYDEFVPIGEKDFIKVPLGVAHFLEHKVFEQEDGTDPFEFFSSHGASANANTSNYKTTYLFQTTDDVKENLEYLLHYVESPYFTDENVEKEKGIIEQELLMYADDPYNVLYEMTLYNTFVEHPMKYSVGGTVESIRKITKEDLYTCYNTFYHPSRMFVVVTDNVKPEEIINIICEHESKRSISPAEPVKIKLVDEPDEVFKNHEERVMEVSIPKVTVAYKIRLDAFNDLSLRDIKIYLSQLFSLQFSDTSLYVEELKKKELIDDSFAINTVYTDTHAVIMISNETNYVNEVVKAIQEGVKQLLVTEEEVERMKKTLISSQIYMSDNIFRMNNFIMNCMIQDGEINTNKVEEIKKMNLKDMEYVLNNLDLSNSTVSVIQTPRKQK